MPTKLIKLEDGTLVEADILTNKIEQISSNTVNKVRTNLKHIKPIIVNTCDPVVESLNEITNEQLIEYVEIDIGLGFEGEGNIYITKAKAKANLSIKLRIRNNKK